MSEHAHGEKLITALKNESEKLQEIKSGADKKATHLIESAEKLLPLLESHIPWHAYTAEQVEHARKLAKELDISIVDIDPKK